MVCVGAATAQIGADDGDALERPAHEVKLSAFVIDRKAVSRTQYEACVSAQQCGQPPALKTDGDAGDDDGAARHISWAQAHRYCIWAGKRLPTEAEFESALRQGKLEADAKSLAWVSDWASGCYSGCRNACDEDCKGSDPRGPCNGAAVCGRRGEKIVKGGPRPSARKARIADKGSASIGFHCAASWASSAPALRTYPPASLSAPAKPPADPTPPSAEQLAAFRDVVEDRDIANLPLCKKGADRAGCRDPDSYVVSNEPRQDLWLPFIRNLGGGFVGVGADQTFTFISTARSQWAWLIDYDRVVVRLHATLRAIVLESETVEDFLHHFTRKQKPKTKAMLRRVVPKAHRKMAIDVFHKIRPVLQEHYQRCAKAPPKRPCWLSSPARYRHIRLLHQQGRIIALGGNLLSKGAMLSIGASAKKMGVPVRLYYPSNADDLWPLSDQYRANVLALPFDDRSVVIRTISLRGEVDKHGMPRWQYMVADGLDQQRLLERPGWHRASWFLRNGFQPDPKVPLTLVSLPAKPE